MTIHDHFDGSAHCIECAGPCHLPVSDERAVSEMIRFTLEYFTINHRGWLPMLMADSLKRLLGDTRLVEFQARAKATNPMRMARP